MDDLFWAICLEGWFQLALKNPRGAWIDTFSARMEFATHARTIRDFVLS